MDADEKFKNQIMNDLKKASNVVEYVTEYDKLNKNINSHSGGKEFFKHGGSLINPSILLKSITGQDIHSSQLQKFN